MKQSSAVTNELQGATSRAAAIGDTAYWAWVALVAERVRARFDVSLAELPGLPLRDGFDCGDSPAEFEAGCVVDFAAERGIAEAVPSRLVLAATDRFETPAWPPPG